MKRLIKLSVSFCVYAWDLLSASFFKIIGRKPSAACVVLYYHAITAEHRKKFAAQMDSLLRYAKPIRADHETALEPGEHYVAVTFDDGFISVIENALPELEARQIPSCIFVPTGSLGQNPLWIKDPNIPARKEIVLSVNELRDLNQARLVTIGSHSVNHPNLAKAEPAKVRSELIESKSRLQEILGAEVTLFSFPHGAHNQSVIEQARQAGYRRVFTISPQVAFVGKNEFVTGRVLVDPTDWPLEFRLKLLGAYRWVASVSTWKSKFRGN